MPSLNAKVADAFLCKKDFSSGVTQVMTTNHKGRSLTTMWIMDLEVATMMTTQYNNQIIYVTFPEIVALLAASRLNAITEALYNESPFTFFTRGFLHGIKANGDMKLEYSKQYALQLFINQNKEDSQ